MPIWFAKFSLCKLHLDQYEYTLSSYGSHDFMCKCLCSAPIDANPYFCFDMEIIFDFVNFILSTVS